MTLITRINRVPNPSFSPSGADSASERETHWSQFGGATLTTVGGTTGTRVQIVFHGEAAGTAGAQVTLTGLTPGVTSRVWVSVPSRTGTTDVKIEIVGASTVSGASFATNEPIFKVGAFNHTADQETATLRIVNATVGGASDTVQLDYAIYDEGQTTNLPYFDGSIPGAVWLGQHLRSQSMWEGYDTDISTRPIAVVEFDSLPVRSTDFVLDRDALDDTNVFTITSPRWMAIPGAKVASIRRGRQSDDEDIDAGQVTITLDDYEGQFDPDNPSSPLRTSKDGAVMSTSMPVRASGLVQYLGTIVTFPLINGDLDDVQIDRTYEPTVIVTARDDLAKLNTADIPPYDPPIGEGAYTLWRAFWALGFAGLTIWDASFGENLERQMLATPGGGNVGSHLRDVAACEGGKLFVRADGRLHIGSHVDDFAYTPAATFTDDPTAATDIEYEDIQTSTSVGRIINRAVITRGDPEAGGKASVTAQDDDSIDRNRRVWSETVEIPLYNDADAQLMAEWRATRRSVGATRVDSIRVDVLSQPEVARILLDLDLADVVRIRRQAWGRTLDGTYSIEGIEQEITAAGKWVMTIYTSPLNITELYEDQGRPFYLDTSALDGVDVMAAF